MNPQEAIPSLRATAIATLPGMRHARALLDVSISVLEYFENYAEKDASTGSSTVFAPPPPELNKEVQSVSAMPSTFTRLHSA